MFLKILFFIETLILFVSTSTTTTIRNKGSSYCLLEATTNTVLEASNENSCKLVASTIKLLTAIVSIEDGDLDSYIKITSDDVNAIGSKAYFKLGDEVRKIDLIYGLLLRSGNDCASALSKNNDEYFIYKMNYLAKSLGMTHTSVSNASGLDEREYNLSTAYDMSILMSYCIKNETFRTINNTYKITITTKALDKYVFINKHKLIIQDIGFVGGKTGYTVKSGRILVSYYEEENKQLICTTINYSDDWNFHKNLVNKYKKLSFVTILKKGMYSFTFDSISYSYYISNDIVIPYLDKEYYINVHFNKNYINLYIIGKSSTIYLVKRVGIIE